MDDGRPDAEPEVLATPFLTPQLQLVAALLFAACLVAISVVTVRRRSTKRGDAVVLAGCSDSGKTAILTALAHGQVLPTHASMQTNTALVALAPGNRTLRVIDVPGHSRIRNHFQEHLPSAKGVAFVIDASTISRNGPAVAEHLHLIMNALTSLPPSRETPSLAIVAHKCDLLKSSATASAEQLAINRVRTILERELEKRRASQASGVSVESMGEESESQLAGLECTGNGEFQFSEWEGGEVRFIGTSTSVGRAADEKHPELDGLSPLREWLVNLA